MQQVHQRDIQQQVQGKADANIGQQGHGDAAAVGVFADIGIGGQDGRWLEWDEGGRVTQVSQAHGRYQCNQHRRQGEIGYQIEFDDAEYGHDEVFATEEQGDDGAVLQHGLAVKDAVDARGNGFLSQSGVDTGDVVNGFAGKDEDGKGSCQLYKDGYQMPHDGGSCHHEQDKAEDAG